MTINHNNLNLWLSNRRKATLSEQESSEMPNLPGSDQLGNAANPSGENDPSVTNTPEQDQDVSDDPKVPDMPDFHDDSSDYFTWKKEFFDIAIKGDTNEMIDALNQVRDRKLTAPQRRFVEDNLEICLLRQDANFDKASKEIRKLISQELDRNNPSVSIMQHINNTLESYPVIRNIFIKMAGQGGFKAELHRRLMAALLGAVQTGSGGNKTDLVYASRDYSINISTRFYTEFGEIAIGKWILQEDDPERYLSETELERLQEGSPEEKRVLRRRVCVESICSKFNNRAFLIHVVDPETGLYHSFAWDIAEALRAGYKEGKLVVRKNKGKLRDAMIDDNGAIIPIFSYAINYKTDRGDMDIDGTSMTEELPFMRQGDGMLYLNASFETLQELAGGMPGMFYHSTPYQGNPTDLIDLMRCFPSSVEMLMRRC